jgi:hypothetical protein
MQNYESDECIILSQLLRYSTGMSFDASIVLSGNQIENDHSLTRVMEFGESKGVSPIVRLFKALAN